MRVQTEPLRAAVSVASQGVAKRPVIPCTGLLRLRSVGDKLVVSGTDAKTFVNVSVPIIVPDVIDVLVEPGKLIAVLERAEFADLTTKGNRLHVKCNGTANLETQSADAFPQRMEIGEHMSVRLTQHQAKALYQFTSPSEKPILQNVVSVNSCEDGIVCCSTEATAYGMCAVMTTGSSGLDHTVVAESLRDALYWTNTETFDVVKTANGGYVLCSNETTEVTFPVTEVPAINRQMYTEPETVHSFPITLHVTSNNCKDIISALEKCIVIEGSTIKHYVAIKLDAKDNQLVISSLGGGYVSEVIPVEGDSFKQHFDAGNLIGALKTVGSMFMADVGLMPYGEQYWIRFRNPDEKIYMLVIPMKVQE